MSPILITFKIVFVRSGFHTLREKTECRQDLGETKASKFPGVMVGRSDKTVCAWRKHFLEEGEVPQSKQGKY